MVMILAMAGSWVLAVCATMALFRGVHLPSRRPSPPISGREEPGPGDHCRHGRQRGANPFLLDDGTVPTEYGTIGKGMHAGLPGHSFVLIDKTGKQHWYGEYPSMWLSNADLLKEISSHLGT